MKYCPLCQREFEKGEGFDVIWRHWNTENYQIIFGIRDFFFRRFEPEKDSRGLIISWVIGLGLFEIRKWYKPMSSRKVPV